MKKNLPSLTIRWEKQRLLPSLKNAATALMELGPVDSSSLPALRDFGESLLSRQIVDHKEPFVRLVAAVCGAELCDVADGKDVFPTLDARKTLVRLFIRQIGFGGEKRGSGDGVTYHHRLFESLASSGAMGLCQSLELGRQLFTAVFQYATYLCQSPKIANAAVKIMIDFVQEVDGFSIPFFASLVMPLIDKKISDERKNPDAVNLCQRLWQEGAVALSSILQVYYGKDLEDDLDHDDDEDDDNDDKTTIDQKTMNEVLIKLFRLSPKVVEPVYQLLGYKLSDEDLDRRRSSVSVLARIFAEKESTVGEDNKNLWSLFIKRFQDIDPEVRGTCAKFSKYYLAYHSDLRADTEQQLHDLLIDPEEEVRSIALTSTISALKQDFSCVSDMLLAKAEERMKDKKFTIRKTAYTELAQLYDVVLTSVRAQDDVYQVTDLERLGGVLCSFLLSYGLKTPEDKFEVVRLFYGYVLGDESSRETKVSAVERAERLAVVLKELNEQSLLAFQKMVVAQANWCKVLKEVLSAYESQMDQDATDGDDAAVAVQSCHRFAPFFSDPLKAKEYLSSFFGRLDDKAILKSLRDAISVKSSSTVVTKAINNIVSKLGRSNLAKTINVLLIRCCSRPIDVDSARAFVEKIDGLIETDAVLLNDDGGPRVSSTTKTAFQMLALFVEHFAPCFATAEVAQKMLEFSEHENELICSMALKILRLISTVSNPAVKALIGNVSSIATKLILSGSPVQAKFSVLAISSACLHPGKVVAKIVPSLFSKLKSSNKDLCTVLKALRHIAEQCPDELSRQRRDAIIEFVINLLKSKQGTNIPHDPIWCSKERLSKTTRAKMMGIKLVAHCLRPVVEITKSVEVVSKCLRNVATASDSRLKSADKSWLRLSGSLAFLQLCAAYESTFFDWSYPHNAYETLGDICLDESYEVKSRFQAKLFSDLNKGHLRTHFMCFFALFGLEARQELKLRAKENLKNLVKAWSTRVQRELVESGPERSILCSPEYTVPAAVHFLAHSSIYGDDHKSLYAIRDCLWFYLEPFFHNQTNIRFVIKLLRKVRTMADATASGGDDQEQEDADKRLYIVSELALKLISVKVTNFGTNEFCGKAWLHPSLFRTKPNANPKEKLTSVLPANFSLFPAKATSTLSTTTSAQQKKAKRPTTGDSAVQKPPAKRNPKKKEPSVAKKKSSVAKRAPSNRAASKRAQSSLSNMDVEKSDDDDEDDDEEEEQEEEKEYDVADDEQEEEREDDVAEDAAAKATPSLSSLGDALLEGVSSFEDEGESISFGTSLSSRESSPRKGKGKGKGRGGGGLASKESSPKKVKGKGKRRVGGSPAKKAKKELKPLDKYLKKTLAKVDEELKETGTFQKFVTTRRRKGPLSAHSASSEDTDSSQRVSDDVAQYLEMPDNSSENGDDSTAAESKPRKRKARGTKTSPAKKTAPSDSSDVSETSHRSLRSTRKPATRSSSSNRVRRTVATRRK
ncbi:sister chromatid cohesion protein PDS5 homolog A-like [Oscarella lobularis]|uniref:sister chromatid cohesion protein PDS5 homolog A-like n=1 Tax=Oscarella lobularis TaxID=121494 RepID=UPI0033131D73